MTRSNRNVKKVQKLVHPKFLTNFGRKPTLLQAFTFVEHMDNAICVEKDSKLTLSMATQNSKPKAMHKANHMPVQGSLS